MQRTFRFFALIIVVIVAILAVRMVWLPRATDGTDHPDWKYVRTVLLLWESGEEKGYVTRWTRPARVIVAAHDEQHWRMAQKAIQELNAALKPTAMALFPMNEESDRGKRPDIVIQFADPSASREADTNFSCEELPEQIAYGCFWHESGAIDGAVIVVYTDDLTFVSYSRLMEELTQALGPANDIADPAFEGSLFYVYHDGQSAPGYKKLGAIDKKLLQFLYNHLKPGDKEKEVRAAFDKHWDTIAVPDRD